MKTETNRQSPATTALTRVNDRVGQFALACERRKDELAKTLDGRISPDLMLRFLMTELRRTPKLAECTDASLLGCLFHAAQLGLLPGSNLGLIHFVPFKKEATPVVGYKGLLQLATNSGFVKDAYSELVYSEDEFGYRMGTDPEIRHARPNINPEGKIIAAYAVAILASGVKHCLVMSIEQIHAVRDRSASYRAWKNGYVNTCLWQEDGPDYPEMVRKTPFRKMFKQLPASVFPPLVQEALAAEDEHEFSRNPAFYPLNGARVVDGEAEPVTPPPPAPPRDMTAIIEDIAEREADLDDTGAIDSAWASADVEYTTKKALAESGDTAAAERVLAALRKAGRP
jgi:phage RecT family recombinase